MQWASIAIQHLKTFIQMPDEIFVMAYGAILLQGF